MVILDSFFVIKKLISLTPALSQREREITLFIPIYPSPYRR